MRVELIGWFLKTKIVSYLLLTNSGYCSWLGTLAKEQCFPFLNVKRGTFNSQCPLLYFSQPNLQETIRDWPDLYLWRYAFQLVLLFKRFKYQSLWRKIALVHICTLLKKAECKLLRASWLSIQDAGQNIGHVLCLQTPLWGKCEGIRRKPHP